MEHAAAHRPHTFMARRIRRPKQTRPGQHSVRIVDLDHAVGAPLAARAVILAAGRGQRMRGVTEKQPKCLLEVGDRTLLDHQIESLQALGVSQISIVVGYRAEQVIAAVSGRAEIVHNARWKETNSLYSAWLCREDAHCDSLLVLNGDVLAHPGIMERVLSVPGSTFAYDSTSGDEDEQMKVELERGVLHSMRKDLTDDRVCGENVGILCFEGRAATLLFDEAEALLKSNGKNLWLAAAVERLARRVQLRAIDTAGLPWCEIDFPEDLWTARSTTWPELRSREWRPASPPQATPTLAVSARAVRART